MNRRISLVTAATVAATVLAGSAAVAANIGVLSAAEDNSIGELSAEATVASPPTTAEAQVVDIYLEDEGVAVETTEPATTAPASAPEVTTQEFAIEGAGTVTLTQDSSGVHISDVDAAAGWLWKTEQSSATDLVVTFASNDTIYEFHASVDDDGVIDARVDQPIVNVVQVPGPAPAPAPAPSGGSGGGSGSSPAPTPATSAPRSDDHDDDGDDDDYDDDHDDDHDDEHEGGEDDD